MGLVRVSEVTGGHSVVVIRTWNCDESNYKLVKGKERRRRAMLSTSCINSKLRENDSPRTNPLIIARSIEETQEEINQSIEMIKEPLEIKENQKTRET